MPVQVPGTLYEHDCAAATCSELYIRLSQETDSSVDPQRTTDYAVTLT